MRGHHSLRTPILKNVWRSLEMGSRATTASVTTGISRTEIDASGRTTGSSGSGAIAVVRTSATHSKHGWSFAGFGHLVLQQSGTAFGCASGQAADAGTERISAMTAMRIRPSIENYLPLSPSDEPAKRRRPLAARVTLRALTVLEPSLDMVPSTVSSAPFCTES